MEKLLTIDELAEVFVGKEIYHLSMGTPRAHPPYESGKIIEI